MTSANTGSEGLQLILTSDLEGLRSSTPEEAFGRVSERCKRRVWRWGRLSEEETEDVAMQAITDVCSLIWKSNATASEVSGKLRTAIDRNRRRSQRLRDRTKYPLLTTPSHDPRDELETRDLMSCVVKLIDGQLRRALHELSPKDRMLIIKYYALDLPGVDSGGAAYVFPTHASQQRALHRARTRFASKLTRLLRLRRLEVTSAGDRDLIQRILEAIQEGRCDSLLLGTEVGKGHCA